MAEQAARSSPPRRRFVAEPIETTRSSKRHQQGKHVVEHVEHTHKKPEQCGQEPQIAIKPEVPASDPTRRRFAPDPVETSMTSSRKKFAPEPLETSAWSSKDRKKEGNGEDKLPPRRKFLPEPVETTSTSTRRRRKVPEPEEEGEERQPSHADLDLSRTSSTTSSSSRKFKPEVIEVARASYRKDRSSSGRGSPKDQQLPSPPSSPETSMAELAEPQESRFSAAALAKRHHQERKHSFQVPELDMIQSESSDEEKTLGLSDISCSASDTDQSSVKGPKYHAIDRKPNNVHQLAAKAADVNLTNQMLAAYINERPYEPVAHFANDDEEEKSPGKLSGINGIDIKTFRRDSGTEHEWELQNMQNHHASLEKMKEDLKKDTAGHSRFSAAALAARHHGIGKKDIQKTKKDDELKKMRSAASPPMLGDELWFPQSLSPKMTRCDVDQAPRPRTNDDHDYNDVEGDPMLWQTHSNVSAHSGAGLWGGLCTKPEPLTRPPTPLRSGLQTPAVEIGNPFESPRPRTPGTKTPSRRPKNFSSHLLSLTPPQDQADTFTARIDAQLNLEREFEEQFPAPVITQIYNYLSLGYPVLAHAFDVELSKISRIPLHELRRDDEHVDAKGHVGVPEGHEEDVSGGKCKRWEALRLYCREWWRQSPQMAERGGMDWGSENRLRRGSWNR